MKKSQGLDFFYNYIWIGGVWNDINDSQLARIKKFCDEILVELDKYMNLVGENKIFIERTANIGIMNAEMCYNYGATGPVLRGAGVDWDLRKKRPYSIYEELDFNVPVGEGLKGTFGRLLGSIRCTPGRNERVG